MGHLSVITYNHGTCHIFTNRAGCEISYTKDFSVCETPFPYTEINTRLTANQRDLALLDGSSPSAWSSLSIKSHRTRVKALAWSPLKFKDCYPSSEIHHEVGLHENGSTRHVPFRRIELTGGSGLSDAYAAVGHDHGSSDIGGIRTVRAEWIRKRKEPKVMTQMYILCIVLCKARHHYRGNDVYRSNPPCLFRNSERYRHV